MNNTGYYSSHKGHFFISPWIITLLVFWLFPLLYSFILSFYATDVIRGTSQFVEFQNYARLFNDENFLAALKNTTIFVIGTIPFTTILALIAAVAINSNIPLKGLFKTSLVIPSITSMVVMALIFSHLYAPGGYVGSLMRIFGISPPAKGLLLSETTALPSIMAMDIIIAFGYYMLLYLAALQNIPRNLYEAAELDGAGAFGKFRHVILPHLKPITLFILVINTIRSFQIFVEIFVMTKGGPLNSTLTAVYFVYDAGFVKFNMGYASAAAYILFILIAVFAALQMKVFGSEKGAR
ncbi:MAG: ABC transporter permease subunit [candidate division Zixibacteria bacterium]|nr:ABC transporter permease subunit [candidate division Zixibacteria bacterium]